MQVEINAEWFVYLMNKPSNKMIEKLTNEIAVDTSDHVFSVCFSVIPM